MTLRQQFDDRLKEIREQVVQMGSRTLEMIHDAVQAVVANDPSVEGRLAAAEQEIDRLEGRVTTETAIVIMQEAPVASDLRMLVGTLGVVGEIESTADITVKLAGCVRKIGGRFPSELRLPLQKTGDLARRAFSTAIHLYGEYSDDKAAEIEALESEIDQSYAEARVAILAMIRADATHAENLLRCLDAFHKLEHVGDRAKEIADRLRSSHRPVV